MKCRVSVILPNYCHSRYLHNRIDSILSQTFQDFELIILDDCSPDHGASSAIIESYRTNPHVSHIVYNEENSGSTFKQWYKGLSLSEGELIWIAESDDSCKDNILENLVQQFDNDSKCVVSFTDSISIDENNNVTSSTHADMSTELYDGVSFIKKYMLTGTKIYNASSALFCKKIALSIDPQYMKFKGAGDYMFWLEMVEQGNVAYIRKQLNFNRRHSSNVTKKLLKNGNNFKELRTIHDYLSKKGYLSVTTRIKSLGEYVYYAYITGFENDIIKKEVMKALKPDPITHLYAYTKFLYSTIKNKVLQDLV